MNDSGSGSVRDSGSVPTSASRAPTIATQGTSFILTLPGVDSCASHSVEIPFGATEVLVRILRSWQDAARAYERKIGFEASPTQFMVDAWLQSNEARVDVRETQAALQARAKAVEEKYGINLEEIEL